MLKGVIFAASAVVLLASVLAASADASTAPAVSDADYVRQHSFLLVSTSPGPGNPLTSYSIYTTHPDGTGKTVVATDGGAPSWTPDGKIIFSSNRSGPQQIWIMDADGSNARQIGNLSQNILPLMAQIGRNGLIVFMGNDAMTEPDGNTGIWMMQSDGSGLTELTRGMQPFLALSGTWVTYTVQTDTPYHRQIWRINTDGTNMRELTFLGDDPDYPDANAPNISPDETSVAFFSGKESDRALPGAPMQSVFDWGHRNVATVPAGGGARTTLTPCKPVTTQAQLDATSDVTGNCIAADNPAWTPDGKWLIFDTGFEPGTETWMVDINGQNFRKFYPDSRGIVRVALKFTSPRRRAVGH
jgi:hypothetical protein